MVSSWNYEFTAPVTHGRYSIDPASGVNTSRNEHDGHQRYRHCECARCTLHLLSNMLHHFRTTCFIKQVEAVLLFAERVELLCLK